IKLSTLVDADRLSQLSGGDAEFQRELLQAFIEDTEADLARVSEAIASGNSEVAGAIASQIETSAVNIGVRLIPELATKLAEVAGGERLEEAAVLLGELREVVEELRLLTQTEN
ncbi:MAG: hypothetical protein F6K35_43415, partial [Okeania sp. SIO2H7]|nr:hypothetical protein [Okeania sp. SIO2H7]